MTNQELTNLLFDYNAAQYTLEQAAVAFREEADKAKREYDERITDLREQHGIDRLEEEIRSLREALNEMATEHYQATRQKTAFSNEEGYKLGVAVGEKVVVTDEAEYVKAIVDAGMAAQLCKVKARPAAKWAKAIYEAGSTVPGTELQESVTVRITLPKREKSG